MPFYRNMVAWSKGVDFLVHNSTTKNILTFQVKSSRAYIDNPRILNNGEVRTGNYKYYLWLNNFVERYERGNADYYIIYGIYPIYKGKVSEKNKCWKSIYLCYSEDEIFNFLKRVRSKSGKIQPFFGYGFNNDKQIFATRGLHEDASQFLLKNKIEEIKKAIQW
jgi:hypothetical protein